MKQVSINSQLLIDKDTIFSKNTRPGFPKVDQMAPLRAMTDIQGA